MNLDDIRISDGVKVHKSFGETVISYLKARKLISTVLKISSTNTDLIIPIIKNADRQQILLDLTSTCEIKIVKTRFITKEISPSSIGDILKKLMPLNLIPFIPTAFDQIGEIARTGAHAAAADVYASA